MSHYGVMSLIEDKVTEMPGWCSVERASALAATVLALQPTITVEIGVFAGRSLIPIAWAHKSIGRGTVFAIDPWDSKIAAEGWEKAADREWWEKENLVDARKVFNDYIVRSHLESIVVTTPMRAEEVRDTTFPHIDFLHIDHAPNKEIQFGHVLKYAPVVRVGGMLFLNDIHSNGNATEALALEGFEQLYRLESGAMYQKTNRL